jgi:hypothetical protein
LITDVHLFNFTLARVENVPVVPSVLDKGHQSKPTRFQPARRSRMAALNLVDRPTAAEMPAGGLGGRLLGTAAISGRSVCLARVHPTMAAF